jgi:hypothetical protein
MVFNFTACWFFVKMRHVIYNILFHFWLLIQIMKCQVFKKKSLLAWCERLFVVHFFVWEQNSLFDFLLIETIKILFLVIICVATLLWVKWEDETPTPKVGDLESSKTPECLEFDRRGENTSHWGVLGVVGKVLKCGCPKCPRIGHLDICSPSYGQKKGRESNW